MERRSMLPWLALAIVSGLALGSFALGISEAPGPPPSANAIVHNAANATLAAPSFTALSTESATTFGTVGGTKKIVYFAPGRVIGVTMNGAQPDLGSLFNVTGALAYEFVSPVVVLVRVTDFTKVGIDYEGTLPLLELLTKKDPAFDHVTVHFVVSVTSGHIGNVFERIPLTVAGRSATITELFQILSVQKPVTPPHKS